MYRNGVSTPKNLTNVCQPYPFVSEGTPDLIDSFARAQTIFGEADFSKIEKIGERPSSYRKDSIYAALISQ
jgi:hypothetical protein